jgi:hypothetical protein
MQEFFHGTAQAPLPKEGSTIMWFRLFSDSGISISVSNRSYFPSVSDKSLSVKIMKPQNIAPSSTWAATTPASRA